MSDTTRTGALIVIDGADGAGKATQTKLLFERLARDGNDLKTLEFPQYTENHFGGLIRECLDGKRGDFLGVDPRIASTLYAADRYESAGQLRTWLEAGAVVILDRYVSSNMLHQGGKIADENELADFLAWLDTIEHEVFAVPRPDLVLYLDVPYSFRRKMMTEDASRATLDTVESDIAYQEAAERNAQRLIARHTAWQRIDCVADEALRRPEEIHEAVYQAVQTVL